MVPCDFGFVNFGKFSQVCDINPLVNASERYPNLAYCNSKEYSFNADGHMYFGKKLFNASTCKFHSGKCSPYGFKPGNYLNHFIGIEEIHTCDN